MVTLVMVISVYFTGEEARSCRLSTTVTRCLRHSQVSARCVYLSTRWVFATPLFLSVHLCSANIFILCTWARSNQTCINLKVRSAVKSHNTFFVIYSCQGRWAGGAVYCIMAGRREYWQQTKHLSLQTNVGSQVTICCLPVNA